MFITRGNIIRSAIVLLLFLSAGANAQDYSGFGLDLGANYQLGEFKNPDAGLHKRTMASLNLEVEPGYYINPKWFVGLLGTYRFENQKTKLAKANQTNAEGESFLIGPAATYHFSDRWAVELGLWFLGNYHFRFSGANDKKTSLQNPLGFNLRAQYYFADAWSVDGVFDYQSWSTIRNEGPSNLTTTQWMLGAGVTWHFGRGPSSSSSSETTSTPPPASKVADTSASETTPDASASAVTNGADEPKRLSGYETGSSVLSAGQKRELKTIATYLKAHPKVKVEIVGHTDSTGTDQINAALSQHRADSGKAELVHHGVSGSRISTSGVGSSQPIDFTETPAGLARNRRIEVHIGR